MKYRIYFLLLIGLLQSCVATYTNRHSFTLYDINTSTEEDPELTAYFYLGKKTIDYPIPFIIVFSEKGDYSLSFQLSDKKRSYSDFVMQDLKIFAEEKLIFESSDSSMFKRDETFIDGKKVYDFVYKSNSIIKIPKHATQVKLYIKYKLIQFNKSIDIFTVEKEFERRHDKGFELFYI